MACHLDHSKLTGLRFCTACGQSLTTGMQSPTGVANSSLPTQTGGTTQIFNQQYPITPELPKNNNKIIYSIAGATFGLVAILGLVALTKSPEPVDVDVSLTLIDEQCFDVSWGFFDIPGGDVELDVDGVTVGYASFPSYGNTTYLGCEFSTTFYGIPSDGDIYSYSMASGRRGEIIKTKEELESEGWSLGLSIG